MCGIFCLLTEKHRDPSYLSEKYQLFKEQIERRGPNASKTECIETESYNMIIASSVLWLQGNDLTIQPITTDTAVFVYNGDIFGGSLIENADSNVCDTILFFNALKISDNIGETVNKVDGPYAFIYLDKENNTLHFGRDKYGRRSLLLGKYKNEFILTSVAKRNTDFDFIELPSIGTFSIDLENNTWQIFPWKRKNKNFSEKINALESFLEQSIHVNSLNFEEVRKFTFPDKNHLTVLNKLTECSNKDVLDSLCSSIYLNKIIKLEQLLEKSVEKRISTQPKFCQNCFKQYNCDHSITGVLFSGGVDCAILALLADRFVDYKLPIDLINVAFERDGDFNVPDRETAVSTMEELKILCPSRKWNLVKVNVTREELDTCRKKYIADLIYPLKSVLDDSLGCVIWFASRAATSNYISPCRTLLVGMGADELFGGYTRHRAAFQKSSWEALHEVLEEDWQNLPYRNLARDDRVASDHGRQLRTPFLDEQVVEFAQNLNCWEKTFPSKKLPQGIGEKLLLRGLAHHLGLRNAATFKKRAMQFGSRIANPKEKGHNISEWLDLAK